MIDDQNESPGVVEPGHVYQHKNGNCYLVLCLTNEPMPGEEPRADHPVGVLYTPFDGTVGGMVNCRRYYHRLLSDWQRSFTFKEMTYFVKVLSLDRQDA